MRAPSRALWPTLIALPALLVLIGLGVWQLQELTWKSDLIAQLEARMAEPIAALPDSVDDPAVWDFRQVRVAGSFAYAATMYRPGASSAGRIGLRVLTPLQRAEGGGWVLIDRGWIPIERHGNSPESGPGAEALVEGVFRAPADTTWLTPANDPDSNLWYRVDRAAMEGFTGLHPLSGYYIQAERIVIDDADPAELPVPGATSVNVRNEHLQYAVTWFALAVALVVIYIGFLRQRARRRQGDCA